MDPPTSKGRPVIQFAHPWMFLLLLLPLAVRLLFPAHRAQRPSLQVPFLGRLSRLTGREPGAGSSVLQGGLGRKAVLPFTWLCVVTAAALPQWLELPVSKEKPMRDMLVAVDLSGSMKTMDFTDAAGKTTDRLTAVKQVLDGFLSHRKGDRVGLLLFGTAPFVQAPFTEDVDLCRRLLGEAQAEMAGQQTAFGDTIGLAITLFDRSPMKDKVLIILTDGNDTSSKVPPVKAAEIAKDKGIVIHTISVGDPKAAGEAALDVPTLESIAKQTGGIYSAASDRSQLESIYQQLDRIETHVTGTISHRPKRDVHHWPIAAGFIASVAYHLSLLVVHALRTKSVRGRSIGGKEIAA